MISEVDIESLPRRPSTQWTKWEWSQLIGHLAVGSAKRTHALLAIQHALNDDPIGVAASAAELLTHANVPSAVASAYDLAAIVVSLDPDALLRWFRQSATFEQNFKEAVRATLASDALDTSNAVPLAFANLATILALHAPTRAYIDGSTGWLRQALSSSDDRVQAFAANALITSRLRASTSITDDDDEALEETAVLLISLLQSSTREATISTCVEALSYIAFARPQFRRVIGTPAVIEAIERKISTGATPYGASMLLRFVTQYPEPEDARSRLRQYANADKRPLDKTADVHARIEELLPSMLPLLRHLSRSPSAATRRNAGTVYLNVSAQAKLRPALLADGAAKALVSIVRDLTRPIVPDQDFDAPHALARLLISANPAIVFTDLIDPARTLMCCLSWDERTPPGHGNVELRMFEVLMALTNIASVPPRSESDVSMAHFLVTAPLETFRVERDNPKADLLSTTLSAEEDQARNRLLPVLSDLLVHDRLFIQRAATQLVCNLVSIEQAARFFSAVDDPASRRRLHILFALTSAKDRPSRHAAAGAIAIMADSIAPWLAALVTRLATSSDTAAGSKKSDDTADVELAIDMLSDQDDDDMLARAFALWTPTIEELGKQSAERKKDVKAWLTDKELVKHLELVPSTSRHDRDAVVICNELGVW